jgi:hypothetical protein
MKRTMSGIAAAAVMAVFAAPEPVAAQQGASWWEWAAPQVIGGEQVRTSRGVVVIPDSRRDRDRNDRGRNDRVQQRRGNAPAFCRSGAGHPVHGRQWCVEKGWGLGDRRYDDRWERRTWEDVIFRSPNDRRRSGTVAQESIAETLGRVVFGRLQGHGHQIGANEPITGRWVPSTTGGHVLQLRSGAVPIAELTDLDGDGRVDVVLVYRGG